MKQFTAEAKTTCSNPHISQSAASIEITMAYHLLSFSWPIGSYVSESLQKLKFCKISQDSDTHLFLGVMQHQTIKMYDIMDAPDMSIIIVCILFVSEFMHQIWACTIIKCMSQLKISNSVYVTKEKAAGPLDSAPMGIKAEPMAKFFIQCYKFQVQDYVVSKFTSFSFLNSFTFPPSLSLSPVILAWCNSQHIDGQKYDVNTRSWCKTSSGSFAINGAIIHKTDEKWQSW